MMPPVRLGAYFMRPACQGFCLLSQKIRASDKGNTHVSTCLHLDTTCTPRHTLREVSGRPRQDFLCEWAWQSALFSFSCPGSSSRPGLHTRTDGQAGGRGPGAGLGVQVAQLSPQPHSRDPVASDTGSHPWHGTSSLQNRFFGAFGVNPKSLFLNNSY